MQKNLKAIECKIEWFKNQSKKEINTKGKKLRTRK